MIQKLLYLMERKGLNLGLTYSIHYYGPYSSDLTDRLYRYDALGYLEIDTTRPTHTVSVKQPAEKSFSDAQERIVDDVLKKYIHKSPLELELITTTDYVANTILSGRSRDVTSIVNEVIKIKGNKFPAEKVEACTLDLKKDSLIPA
ncbi:MAG: SocA family protein [Clostridiales bacterium]|nr:SocA family protein [Clostridiales bacterium]